MRHHSLKFADLSLRVHQIAVLKPRALPGLHVRPMRQPARAEQAESQVRRQVTTNHVVASYGEVPTDLTVVQTLCCELERCR